MFKNPICNKHYVRLLRLCMIVLLVIEVTLANVFFTIFVGFIFSMKIALRRKNNDRQDKINTTVVIL